MAGKFGGDINLYFKHCHNLIKDDWDNVILVTGKEGTGKTTWAMQIAKQLDPEGFPGDLEELERIQFTHDEFLDVAAKAPRGAAVLWDEGRLHKRRAMHGSTLDVLDFLQDCRALNLHLIICFPHESQLDAAVKDHRIRTRWHIPYRGTAVLMERRERHKGRGITEFYWHRTGDKFSYGPNKGPIDDAYRAKKEEHMRRKALDESSDLGGFDVFKADAVLARHDI